MSFIIDRNQLKSEQVSRVLPEGDYPFEVISAELKPSAKSANGQMFALKLRVVDEDGKSQIVKDWLGAWNYGLLKVQAFCESIGLENEFTTGVELTPEMFVGLSGTVHTKVGEYNGKPQPNVGWYVPERKGAAKKSQVVTPSNGPAFTPVTDLTDEIPF